MKQPIKNKLVKNAFYIPHTKFHLMVNFITAGLTYVQYKTNIY